MPRIALFQMNSGIDADENFRAIADAARKANEGGAQILFTPEMSLLLDRDRVRAKSWIESSGPTDLSRQLAQTARDNGIDIALGSMPTQGSGERWANRSIYFRSDGAHPITYDKIHMFDVELASGESWRESNAYEPGRDVVTVNGTPLGKLGLTVCYDVRFPALFEELGQRHCDAIAVPAAFTVPTGEAHWHLMLRARAVEASAFVIAAAQVGEHEDGRVTYGHSLVVDPWGEILLDMGGDGPGIDFADIALERIDQVRSQVPSLANRRPIPKSETSS